MQHRIALSRSYRYNTDRSSHQWEIGEKYKKNEHFNPSCANGHFNNASEEVVKHQNECPARWIFQKWQSHPWKEFEVGENSKAS